MTIDIKNLSVKKNNTQIIDNLNLHINKFEKAAIVAPNGEGKTTLFRAITNIIKHQNGVITFNGINSKNRINFNKQFFFIENSNVLFSQLSAIDHLKLVKNLWKSNVSIEKTIVDLEINNFKNLPVSKMSLGMKQKLLIALYVISDTPILIFDEPFNGLDIGNKNMILRLLQKSNNKTILLASHNTEEIMNICDKVFFLKEKKIIFESKDTKNIEKLYSEMYL